MIYLASPYSAKIHDCAADMPNCRDEVTEHKRYIEACYACGMLMMNGDTVYSPIAHWHLIDRLMQGSIGYEDYLAADFEMIDLCSELHVLMLDGWKESRGVTLEIEYAKLKNKPVKYLKLDEQGVHYAEL
jgi:hypothetical protein